MSIMLSKTRSSAEVWLMGKGTEELSGSNLPTNADAFRLLLFFYVHGTRHRWWTKILLGIPTIGRGTGKEQAEACLSTLNDWGSPESSSTTLPAILVWGTVRALSLQELAWVACRHRVMELPLLTVFSSLFWSTRGPYFAMFRRFQQTWPSIDHI